jgi:2-keto-3-deoxy-L-rhamnonate aldolase RhmA
MHAARTLRKRLEEDHLTTGILVTDHLWPDLVEISTRAGLDYLIIDMEHGCASTEVIAQTCAIGRQSGFPVLIRPNNNEYSMLRLAVDLGPCGFLLACVESPADLDTAREAVYLPPRGRRRPGGPGNRWVADFSAAAWKAGFEDQFVVLPQIETKRGLENAAAIARHPLTTALAVGPYDLSAELGVCGRFDAPEFQHALESILATARRAGKPGWMIGPDPASLARDGWRFLCVGEPTSILESALRQRVEAANRYQAR